VKVHFRRVKRKTHIYGDYDDEGAEANMNKEEDNNIWTENKEDKRMKTRGKSGAKERIK